MILIFSAHLFFYLLNDSGHLNNLLTVNEIPVYVNLFYKSI